MDLERRTLTLMSTSAPSRWRIDNTPVGIMLYVEDVDAVFNKAVSMGATINKPLTNQFYGDRNGTLIDPFGHKWTVGTHVEDVSPEEMKKRMAAIK